VSLCFLLLGLALVNSKHFTPRKGASMEQSFEEYNVFFNKTHATAAMKRARFINFLESSKNIEVQNKNSKSAFFGFTKFSDMSEREFKTKMLMPTLKSWAKVDINTKRSVQQPSGAIDWVARGMTTAVKNQEQCGSCWAFSATETIESVNLIAGKISQSGTLSPQEIVDCDTNDSGCSGGWPSDAMQWVINQGGQDTEASYPYTGQDGTCAESSGTIGATISAVHTVASDESVIYQQLQSVPLSICCDASQWSNYAGGVLTASQCGTSIDHAIQLTGYSPNQGGYWIVRNSWGADWGENGFIYLQYGQDTCGITSTVTYASV